MMALERHRQNTRGVLVHSIRGGGGAATAKLPLQSEDIILKVGDQPIGDTAAPQTRYGPTGGRQNRAGAGAGAQSNAIRNNS